MSAGQSRAGTSAQFVKYAVVGAASNLALYALYLLVTFLGLEHKVAMTLLYVIGVLQTFVFNKRWSFRHKGTHAGPFARYLAAYLGGYALNLAALLILVDWAGYPHQVVQGVLILVIGLSIFALCRSWVFAGRQERSVT